MSRIAPWFLVLVMLGSGLSLAATQEMVSVASETVLLYTNPDDKSQALWELDRGYPLKVISRKDGWIQVQDFEKDKGWIKASTVDKTPHHIVRVHIGNIRTGPGLKNRLIGQAARYELLSTVSKKSSWVQVKRKNGQTGWIAESLVWGW